MSIPVHKPFIKRRDMDAVLSCMVSDMVAPFSQSDQLVDDCKKLYACDEGSALREYQRALELSIDSLELPAGSFVGVSVLSPSVHAKALSNCNLVPVYLDVNEHNPTISLQSLQAVQAQTPLAALLIHDSLGFVHDHSAIKAFGLPVVEDISQAFGHPGAGLCGNLLVLGMEPDAIVTCGGGCLVLARGKHYAQNLARHAQNLLSGAFLPDMNAALGRTQIIESQAFLERRHELYQFFARAVLRGHHRVLAPLSDTEQPCYSLCVLAQSGVADMVLYARKKQVDTAMAFSGSILQAWADDDDPMRFPHAYAMLLRAIIFPLYPGLRKKEIETLEKVLATLP